MLSVPAFTLEQGELQDFTFTVRPCDIEDFIIVQPFATGGNPGWAANGLAVAWCAFISAPDTVTIRVFNISPSNAVSESLPEQDFIFKLFRNQP